MSISDPGWNWVTALSECSAVTAFEALKFDIEHDVDKRNSLLPVGTVRRFDASRHNDSLIVSGAQLTATFTLTGKVIAVRDECGKLILEATLTINDKGECRFKIDGKEYESWQVRKRALEKLFFETV